MQNNFAPNQYQNNNMQQPQGNTALQQFQNGGPNTPAQNKFQTVTVQVYSNYTKTAFNFEAQVKQDDNGQQYYCLLHNSIKTVMLHYMAECANKPNITPIVVDYHPIATELSHTIVDCTVSQGTYSVTETGEASIATLNSSVAKEYPYIEAQTRAYDRAMISFLQLNVDGKRLYSDHEFTNN